MDFFHYRDRDDFEVDIVLERGSVAVAGVEAKAAASVTDADFRRLRKLRDVTGRQFAVGVVLYDGASAVRFGDNLFAVPMRVLWETLRRGAGRCCGTRAPWLGKPGSWPALDVDVDVVELVDRAK